MQQTLIPGLSPPKREGIDLQCCDVLEMLGTVKGADLVIADPPWTYSAVVNGDPSAHYALLPMAEIWRHLRASAAACGKGARLAVWTTSPLMGPFMAGDLSPWEYLSAGAWLKRPHHGPGWHWAGVSEYVLLYKLGGTPYRDTMEPLKNGWVSPPTEHSEKPIGWQAGMIRKWVPPGGLVVDLYAGRGSVARAVLRAGEGRRYVGAEIDPDRHASAMALIAQEGPCP